MSKPRGRNGSNRFNLDREERAVVDLLNAVGYDDSKKRFLIRNSFTLPYPYLDSRDLSDDFWTIRREGIDGFGY